MEKKIELSNKAYKYLSYLSEFFNCPGTEVLEQLLSYTVCSLENSLEDHHCSDLINHLGLEINGYDFTEKVAEKYR